MARPNKHIVNARAQHIRDKLTELGWVYSGGGLLVKRSFWIDVGRVTIIGCYEFPFGVYRLFDINRGDEIDVETTRPGVLCFLNTVSYPNTRFMSFLLTKTPPPVLPEGFYRIPKWPEEES